MLHATQHDFRAQDERTGAISTFISRFFLKIDSWVFSCGGERKRVWRRSSFRCASLSEETTRYFFGLWTLIDIELGARPSDRSRGAGAAFRAIVGLAGGSDRAPVLLLSLTHTFLRGTIPFMTWGGLAAAFRSPLHFHCQRLPRSRLSSPQLMGLSSSRLSSRD